MKKVSVNKLSVVGVVLLAASAVTAAIVPSKSKDLKQTNSVANAFLKNASGAGTGGGVDSCVIGAGTPNCHITVGSLTGNDSSGVGVHTGGNTSHSIPFDSNDNTSVVS